MGQATMAAAVAQMAMATSVPMARPVSGSARMKAVPRNSVSNNPAAKAPRPMKAVWPKLQ